jgi:hypothetical protein
MIDGVPEVSDLESTADRYEAIGASGNTGSPGPRRFSVLGLILALLSAAGLTMAITLLYNGMAVVMETEGGFVATGGPYVIAHPAPDWIGLIPISILGLFLFGGINLYASARGWGISLVVFAWMGLFISLGWNFLRLGSIPPEGLQGAWAWIMCGVVFWIMGFAPMLLLLGAGRAAFQGLMERQGNRDARRVWRMPSRRDTTGLYLGVQLFGALAGVVAGVALFARLAG